ncbi:hypothetical protein [Flavobacterium faecale]|uniref:hypothetical protein n=1 Tax=Flavobacterium faecale TaxID=1355330 RepID=UPI003AAA3B9A
MKKISLSIVCLLLLCTALVSANELKPKKTNSKVFQELTTFLTPQSSVGELENETVVKVKIRINANNEIVVLQTDSFNEELNNYINESLNFKKLKTDELLIDTIYVFDVNFQS